jgi:hypothetical protein
MTAKTYTREKIYESFDGAVCIREFLFIPAILNARAERSGYTDPWLVAARKSTILPFTFPNSFGFRSTIEYWHVIIDHLVKREKLVLF